MHKKTGLILILAFSAMYLNAQVKVQFAYDKNNRLTGYEFPGLFTRSYYYDESGNRVKKNNDKPIFTYLPAAEIHGEIIVYPNPFRGEEFFITGIEPESSANLQLYDIRGMQMPLEYEVLSDRCRVRIVGNASPGIYFLRLKTEKEHTGIKLIRLPD